MIKYGKMFHFAVIAFFLFALQITTLHTKHHLHKDADHCLVCQSSKHLNDSRHFSTVEIIMDVAPLHIEELEEKRVMAQACDLTQKPMIIYRDLRGLKHLHPLKPNITYRALAPPHSFS